MQHGSVIIGAGVASALMLTANAGIEGRAQYIPWRLLNVGLYTGILAILDAVGLGQIAAALAVLVAGLVAFATLPRLLQRFRQMGG